ncbi:TetR/AcrR family transcriptional regulator [Clostridium sp.]|uniref:TetR/AcrR family transcriptional regulator n=1 Tax=Clostridium sp. TaxID=1506 RepID=UPI002842400C|nr:TetR/AcrR family transcriptional regulator [Clostridium sp.]MDR3598003.1 TetR/AcrR family transcriptional regulator [Clostridium sp.]
MSRIIENPQKLILSKAKEILYNEGYPKLTMRNVSKACDIALGTIYNYYPTKKELVVEMMTDYWREYMDVTQDIAISNYEFYDKLNKIFDTLSVFIKTFKDAWLKPKLYDNPDYVSYGMEREHIYIEKLVHLIEDILIKDNKVNNSLGYYETAKFIVMNFITIIQMPAFKYSSFEVVLKELLN